MLYSGAVFESTPREVCTMPTLLLIDDEPAIQHAFQRAFRDSGLTLVPATTAAEAIAELVRVQPDVIVLDVRLPDATGLETYHRIRQIDSRIPVIIITGHGTTELAIQAIKEGAYEYILKPLELVELRDLVDRAVRTSRQMNVPAAMAEESIAATDADLLIGRCPAMQEVYKAIGRVAAQDVTVLILGESGTGKELVARALYQHSRRAQNTFLAVNCGAIPETLLESELFGHEKGAFTGADRRRIGKFEQCHGGTLFLDEVGEMTPLTQTKMLRVIQEQRFERVGGTETVQTNVRVIAATNANLEHLAAVGRFRKDLFFRLNVFTIHLPPLRERGDDIPLLIDYYVRRFGQELSKPAQAIAPEAIELLRAYTWPGNVRELESVVKQSLLKMHGPVLLAEFLPAHVQRLTVSTPLASSVGSTDGEPFGWDRYVAERIAANTEALYGESLTLMEREVLTRVLRHTEGNQLQAARILGITRGSLRNKIRTLGINIARSVWSEDDQREPG